MAHLKKALAWLETQFWRLVLPVISDSQFLRSLIGRLVRAYDACKAWLKRPRIQLYAIGTLVVTGLLCGLLLLLPSAASAGPHASAADTPIPTTGQRNFLLFNVDSLDVPQARLGGLWLVMQAPDSASFTFMPLYPTAGLPAHEPLWVEPGDPQALDNLDLDLPGDLWWNESLWFDQIALIELLDQIGGLEVASTTLQPTTAISSLPAAWAQPTQALIGQTTLFESVCRQSARLAAPDNLDALLTLIPGHLLTSMDSYQLIAEWHKLAAEGFHLECKFPFQP